MRGGQTGEILKVRIYFGTTGFIYELSVGCDRRGKKESKVTPRFLAKQLEKQDHYLWS